MGFVSAPLCGLTRLRKIEMSLETASALLSFTMTPTTLVSQSFQGTEEEVKVEEERNANFRLKVEEFSFKSPQTSPVRRSARSTTRKLGTPTPDADVKLVTKTPTTTLARRKRAATPNEEESPTKAKKKRGYAPPEAYAHLNYLTDCLGEYLDGTRFLLHIILTSDLRLNPQVLFCGIKSVAVSNWPRRS